MEPTYKGHAIRTLIVNTAIALWPIMIFQSFKSLLSFDLKGINLLIVVVLVFCLIWTIARPSYLFFEAKHILTKDGIAEPLDLGAVIVFGGMSIIGFVAQIYLNTDILRFFELGNNRVFVIGLALLASFGACLGLTDLQMAEIFLPTKVLHHVKVFFKSWKLVILCICNTLVISIFTFFIFRSTPL